MILKYDARSANKFGAFPDYRSLIVTNAGAKERNLTRVVRQIFDNLFVLMIIGCRNQGIRHSHFREGLAQRLAWAYNSAVALCMNWRYLKLQRIIFEKESLRRI